MSNDITFCAEDCNNRMCFSHPSNISKVPHTFAYLKGTEACPMRNQEQRLIDANAERTDCIHYQICSHICTNKCQAYEKARSKGEWIKDNSGDRFCSECGSCALYHEIGVKIESRFCPNCGADMQKGAEE